MAETLIWWDVVDALVTGISGQPMADGVTVAQGWPGDEIDGELIWVGDLSGDTSIPVSKAGRMIRDDFFDVPINFRVNGRADVNATGRRLTEMLSAAEDYLADHVDLSDLDGVVSAEITGRQMGVRETTDGPVGFGQITVQVHSRLT